MLARVGAAAVFAVTAASALVFIVVLLGTRRPAGRTGLPPERFASALRAGGRYVRNSPVVRRMLLRVLLFVLPGAAVWALLPVVADQRLSGGSTGFGLLLGSLGAGEVLGAAVLPRLTAHLSANRVLVVSAVLFAVSLVACVTVPNLGVLAVLLVPAGMAWLFVLMGVTGALQVFLPRWVRARGLSTYNMVFAASQATGALLWGVMAQALGLVPTFLAAAVLMIAGAVTVTVWPLPDVAHWNSDSAVYWAEPELTYEPDPQEGPVLVTVRYVVPPESQEAFLEGDGAGATHSTADRGDELPALPRRSRPVGVPPGPVRPDVGGAPAPAHRAAHRHGSGAGGAGALLRGRGGGGRPPLPGVLPDRADLT